MGNIKCQHCDYEWNYFGEMLRATCPNCGYKVVRHCTYCDAPLTQKGFVIGDGFCSIECQEKYVKENFEVVRK